MLQVFSSLTLALGLALTAGLWTVPAQASDDYEELSYQDLVDQLREKRRRISQPRTRPTHPMDEISLHANLALATNMSSFSVGGRNVSTAMNGFQIGLGIDLFSPDWRSELALRNFGTRETGNQSQSLRELDLKVYHRTKWADRLSYRLGSGLSTRYIRYSDTARNIHLSEESPNLMLLGGIDSEITPGLSMGAELGARTALADQNIDRNSLDFMLRVETSF